MMPEVAVEKPKRKDGSIPVGENLSIKNQELLNYISRHFGGKYFRHGSIMDIPQISVEPQDLWSVCEKLKTSKHTDFKMLLCLAGVDYVEYIQIVYILYSLNRSLGIAFPCTGNRCATSFHIHGIHIADAGALDEVMDEDEYKAFIE